MTTEKKGKLKEECCRKNKKLCFPPIKYDRRTEKEQQQFHSEIIEELYPFLKEFLSVH